MILLYNKHDSQPQISLKSTAPSKGSLSSRSTLTLSLCASSQDCISLFLTFVTSQSELKSLYSPHDILKAICVSLLSQITCYKLNFFIYSFSSKWLTNKTKYIIFYLDNAENKRYMIFFMCGWVEYCSTVSLVSFVLKWLVIIPMGSQKKLDILIIAKIAKKHLCCS